MMLRVVVVAVGLLLPATASLVRAQSETIIRPPPTLESSQDERMAKWFGEGKVGAVALDVDIPGHKCDMIPDRSRQVGRRPMAEYVDPRIVLGVRYADGLRRDGHVPAGRVPPAEGQLQFGNHTTRLNGPYAKFQIKIGEVVNLGVLRLDYKTEGVFVVTGTLKKSIAGMTPETRAKMKEQFPRMFPKAVERHMTMVGPADVNIRKR